MSININREGHTPSRTVLLLFMCAASQFLSLPAMAGPPFLTDDPEPVEYRHWEFYVASIQEYLQQESDATLPHIEINYGLIPDVQIHLVAPMEYRNGGDGTAYGYSNTEVGVKYRCLQDTASSLQIGVFPLVELPTGDRAQQLSNGSAQVYLPLWIQKSWGKLTTYGGGGYWLDYGMGTKNWMFAGWEVQYDVSDMVTFGGEVFYHTSESPGATSRVGFNAGGFINLNDHHHILYSVGHSMSGTASTTAYIGYQYTI